MARRRRAVFLCGQARAPLAAIARELARADLPLLIQAAGADAAGAQRLCRSVGRSGGEARVVLGELNGDTASRHLVAAAWRARSIETVVICPGIAAADGATEPELDEWEAGLAAGLRAPFFLAKHVALRFRQGGGGQVVFAIGGAPRDGGAVASVVRAGLLCMVDALARAVPAEVAVHAVVGGVAPRQGAAEMARGVRALLAAGPRASGTMLALGARAGKG